MNNGTTSSLNTCIMGTLEGIRAVPLCKLITWQGKIPASADNIFCYKDEFLLKWRFSGGYDTNRDFLSH